MDAILQKAWAAFEVYGLVGILLFLFIAGAVMAVREVWFQFWHWGFRPPCKDDGDEGGEITLFVKDTRNTQHQLTAASAQLTAAANRAETKLDAILNKVGCRHPGGGEGSGAHSR